MRDENEQAAERLKAGNPLKHARLEIDTEDEILIVRFEDRPGCMTHVDLTANITTLLNNIEEAISGYDEAVAESNVPSEDTLL